MCFLSYNLQLWHFYREGLFENEGLVSLVFFKYSCILIAWILGMMKSAACSRLRKMQWSTSMVDVD